MSCIPLSRFSPHHHTLGFNTLAWHSSERLEFIAPTDSVKALLLAHCTDLARDPYIQGKGMPNLVKILMNA